MCGAHSEPHCKLFRRKRGGRTPANLFLTFRGEEEWDFLVKKKNNYLRSAIRGGEGCVLSASIFIIYCELTFPKAVGCCRDKVPTLAWCIFLPLLFAETPLTLGCWEVWAAVDPGSVFHPIRGCPKRPHLHPHPHSYSYPHPHPRSHLHPHSYPYPHPRSHPHPHSSPHPHPGSTSGTRSCSGSFLQPPPPLFLPQITLYSPPSPNGLRRGLQAFRTDAFLLLQIRCRFLPNRTGLSFLYLCKTSLCFGNGKGGRGRGGLGLVPVDDMVAIVKCGCGCASVNVEARFLFSLVAFKYKKSFSVVSWWEKKNNNNMEINLSLFLRVQVCMFSCQESV